MDVTPPGEGPTPLGRGWPKPAFVDPIAPVAVNALAIGTALDDPRYVDSPSGMPRVAAVGHRHGDGLPLFRDPAGEGLLFFTPGTALEITTPRGPAQVGVAAGYRLVLIRPHGDMPAGSFVVIDERGDLIRAAPHVDPVGGLPRSDPPQPDPAQPAYGKGIMADFLLTYTSSRIGRGMALVGHAPARVPAPAAPLPAAAPPAGRPGRAIELE
jgi:hypothetical protein